LFPFNTIVPFYGANPKPIEAVEKITGPVLAIYAAEDDSINSGLPAILESMIKYKKTFEMKLYKGALPAAFRYLDNRFGCENCYS
jgi:carboxymethylenebutenolidase